MSRLIDLTGKKFNRLTVVERAENAEGGIAVWKCKCDCGNTTFVRGGNLKSGAVKSCGCLRHEAQNKTHDMSKTRLYREWASIKSRCVYKSSKTFKSYGGRGITICDEWMNSFEVFRDWALSHGYADNLTIERVDNDGNYCPENCKWIPKKEQARNRRSCYSITYNGKTQNLVDWCNELNLDYKMIHNRIHKLSWNFERAISEPIHIEKRNRKR